MLEADDVCELWLHILRRVCGELHQGTLLPLPEAQGNEL
jgi:hypothetical protein